MFVIYTVSILQNRYIVWDFTRWFIGVSVCFQWKHVTQIL